MIYPDEESRDHFHKLGSLLQLVAQMFDSFAMHCGVECALVGFLASNSIIMELPSDQVPLELALDIAEKINSQFERIDDRQTVTLLDEEALAFEIFVTTAYDLRNLH